MYKNSFQGTQDVSIYSFTTKFERLKTRGGMTSDHSIHTEQNVDTHQLPRAICSLISHLSQTQSKGFSCAVYKTQIFHIRNACTSLGFNLINMQHGRRKSIIGLHCNHSNHLSLVLNQRDIGTALFPSGVCFFQGSHVDKAMRFVLSCVKVCLKAIHLPLSLSHTHTIQN